MNTNTNANTAENVAEKTEVYKNEPFGNEVTFKTMDSILENEKITNKSDAWNKLNKYEKVQRLHLFAESYGNDNSLNPSEINSLKNFLSGCIDKNKLNKTKDVVYNKNTQIITSIPALHFNQATQSFSLKITDAKRVSTIKSLTPKRTTSKVPQSGKTDIYIETMNG
jgi:hypothetical protein